MRTDPGMTLVTALIRPEMEGRVVSALHELPEFPGFSLVEVCGQGRGLGAGGAYKATEYEFDFAYLRHLQLQIVCPSNLVSDVCRTIAETAWTGHKGDGVVFTSEVESFLSIREAGHRTQEGGQ